MKKQFLLALTAVLLLAGIMALAGLHLEETVLAAPSPETEATAEATSTPEASPTPDVSTPLEGLAGILERMVSEYDPDAGASAAYRWAESVLEWYLADGRSIEAARAAGEAYAARYGENDDALRVRLETVQSAAEVLTSGENSGIICSRRILSAVWEPAEAADLFSAIADGAGLA